MFQTNLNEVITFITNNIFLRAKSNIELVRFNLSLCDILPAVPVNEYVVWGNN